MTVLLKAISLALFLSASCDTHHSRVSSSLRSDTKSPSTSSTSKPASRSGSRPRAHEGLDCTRFKLSVLPAIARMSIARPFRATDLFKFNNVNLDIWTETYGISFYLGYLSRWPDLCCIEESPSGRMMGYVIGKAEGTGADWHGHITALSVAPEYRRLSLARKMIDLLERISDENYRAYFVDLYVRCANNIAISMYEGFGYSVYRRIREYYGNLGLGRNAKDEEDAFDMRKPLSRDPMRRSVRSNGREIVVSAHDAT